MSNLEKKFLEFHARNPKVYQIFEEFSLKVASQIENYGVAAIWERMRWHINFETKEELIDPDTQKPIKLNNNHKAYYARMFMRNHPKHEGFFRTRELTSK